MADFVPGAGLARAFYEEVVAEIIGLREHSAALIGYGSEVLGFDTERSVDHGWGPRLQVFVEESEVAGVLADLEQALPESFHGWRTRFGWDDVAVEHHVEVATLAVWLQTRLGVDSTRGLDTRSWLVMPHQRLAEITTGPVFHDDSGALAAARAELGWYPEQVWLWALGCQWRRIAQEEAFVGRAAEVGDELGSRILAARIARDLVRLCFLMERCYPPYSKWLGAGFARLESAADVGVALDRALSATTYLEREAGLADAYRLAGIRHNRLGLTEAVEPQARSFYGRPYLVSAARDFLGACLDRVQDPVLRGLAPLGTIDQCADSTDVLAYPVRAAAAMDGLVRAPDQSWRR
ncbi:MAG TPA: DUF4037 domain-containing protein [Acidimicrobiales bacterium]|nr:DUF4037 domain-containing protein [Acidimicrobiales bacterium]